MGKIVKLIFVSGDKNSNKYYNLFEQSDGTFKVDYGRVDSTTQHTSYPMSQWDKKYNEKLRKGYKDITELYAINDNGGELSEKELFISNDTYVKRLIEDLQRYAKHTVSQNYKVSTKNVTKKMVDEAQIIVDEIAKIFSSKHNKTDLNELLLKLFTIIPRKMGNVKDYLVKDEDSKDTIAKLIDNEQSILDSLAGQVSVQEPEKIILAEDDKSKSIGLLDSMGVEVTHVTDTTTIDMVKKLMGESANLFSKLFEVKNHKTEKTYNSLSIENEKLLWHGSKNQNYFSLLQNGLLIRPSGVATNGAMFGTGGYLTNKSRKSIGYTSLSGSYWAGGSESKAYLLLFAANLGNIKNIYEHKTECYNFNSKTISPYNSVHAHAGRSLMNDEIIIYDEKRTTMRYLVEIKK